MLWVPQTLCEFNTDALSLVMMMIFETGSVFHSCTLNTTSGCEFRHTHTLRLQCYKTSACTKHGQCSISYLLHPALSSTRWTVLGLQRDAATRADSYSGQLEQCYPHAGEQRSKVVVDLARKAQLHTACSEPPVQDSAVRWHEPPEPPSEQRRPGPYRSVQKWKQHSLHCPAAK